MIYRRLEKIGIDLVIPQIDSRWINSDGRTNVAVRYVYPSAGIPYVIDQDSQDINMPTICLAQEIKMDNDFVRMNPKGFFDFYEDIRLKITEGFCREIVAMTMPLYDNPDPCKVEVWMRSPIEVKSYNSPYKLKEILNAELRISIFSPKYVLLEEQTRAKHVPAQPNFMDIMVERMLKEMDKEEE